MNFTLRQATPDDAGLIADISRQSFYDTFAPDNSKENMDKFLDQQFTRGRLMLEVGAPENTFFLAYHEKEVAGYVKLKDGNNPAGLGSAAALEIARLYAMKAFIGRGVGRILMQTSIQVAQEREKELVWLGVWEHNVRAIDFYKGWGFERFGEQEFLLGDDVQIDWLMKKKV